MIITDKFESQPEQPLNKGNLLKRNSIKASLSIIIILSLIATVFFAYPSFLRNHKVTDEEKAQIPQARIVQLDILNGCGVKGIGARFTDYLRSHGFDVVEMKNYKTFQIPQTLVVDRIGDLKLAQQVASALGVSQKNIIQQINPDYFVDVSVIIGKNYTQLIPSQ